MEGTPPPQELEKEIERMKGLIAGFEKKMAVHPTQLGDPKKAEYCPNRRGRMQYRRRRDELVARLAVLQLNKELTSSPVRGVADDGAALAAPPPHPAAPDADPK
jgi:hypothetical protein